MARFIPLDALRALAEIHRLRILRLLFQGASGVNDIAAALKMTQYNASKHLRVLKDAGLVECKTSGRMHLYEIAAEYRRRASAKGDLLDLGFCKVDFGKLPK